MRVCALLETGVFYFEICFFLLENRIFYFSVFPAEFSRKFRGKQTIQVASLEDLVAIQNIMLKAVSGSILILQGWKVRNSLTPDAHV